MVTAHELPRVGVLDHHGSGRNLLEYLFDMRGYCKAFRAAQDAGSIPDDEIPMPYLVLSNQTFEEMLDEGRVRIDFPNDLARPARLRAMSWATEAGIPGAGIIHGQSFAWRDGMTVGWAWMKVAADRYLHGRTLLRSYQFDWHGGTHR